MSGHIEHRSNEHRFVYLNAQGQVEGQLNYDERDDHHWLIHHTGVDEALQGQGIAKRLVDAAYEYSLANNIQLSSSCSYASRVLASK